MSGHRLVWFHLPPCWRLRSASTKLASGRRSLNATRPPNQKRPCLHQNLIDGPHLAMTDQAGFGQRVPIPCKSEILRKILYVDRVYRRGTWRCPHIMVIFPSSVGGVAVNGQGAWGRQDIGCVCREVRQVLWRWVMLKCRAWHGKCRRW